MIDFITMTDDQVATFAEECRVEMDAQEVTAAEIIEFIQEGKAIIERRYFGFAIIQPEDAPGWVDSPGLHLWLLYVAPDERGKGKGKRFVKELLAAHGQKYYATVTAFGSKRATFFARCGFRIVERDKQTGRRYMETWR